MRILLQMINSRLAFSINYDATIISFAVSQHSRGSMPGLFPKYSLQPIEQRVAEI
jgi:hypothetical protein